MYDNKVRLSPDVLEKARLIAEEWGLKNPRAAVEAVFRRYADDYLTGRNRFATEGMVPMQMPVAMPSWTAAIAHSAEAPSDCEALEALDDLLGL